MSKKLKDHIWLLMSFKWDGEELYDPELQLDLNPDAPEEEWSCVHEHGKGSPIAKVLSKHPKVRRVELLPEQKDMLRHAKSRTWTIEHSEML